MSTILSWLSGVKVWLYAAVAAAFAALLAYAKFEAHEKRKAQDALAAQKAEHVAADAKAQLQHVEVRDEVRTEVEKMPAPSVDPQPVATAPPDSAAGKLRDDWARPAGQ